MQNQRIRIRLKAFDHKLIDASTQEIVRDRTPHWRAGPWTHPTSNEEGKVHHPYFTSREQGCAGPVRDSHTQATHGHYRANGKTVDALMKLDLAAGVEVQISLG